MAILYHHWLSPAARFARILLVEKNIPFEMVLEKEWRRRPEFLALNPAGEVPVFVTDTGHALSGTAALAEYLEDIDGQTPLLPTEPLERHEVRRLVGWFHAKFSNEVSRLLVQEKLYKSVLKLGTLDTHALRCAAYNLKIHLKYLGHLAEQRHYLAGPHFTLADAAAAAHISVVDYFDHIAWQDWPHVKDWYVRVKSRKSMRALLSDRIGGLQPPPHYAQLDF